VDPAEEQVSGRRIHILPRGRYNSEPALACIANGNRPAHRECCASQKGSALTSRMRVNKGDILDVPLGGLAREEGRRSRDGRCPCAEGGDDPAADSRFIVLLFVLWHLTLLRRDRWSGHERSSFPVTRHLKVPGLGPRKREAIFAHPDGTFDTDVRKILPEARQRNRGNEIKRALIRGLKPMEGAAAGARALSGLAGFSRSPHELKRDVLGLRYRAVDGSEGERAALARRKPYHNTTVDYEAAIAAKSAPGGFGEVRLLAKACHHEAAIRHGLIRGAARHPRALPLRPTISASIDG
jgi:hypothetical protein